MKRFSKLLMAAGFLLVLSAVALYGYNRWESDRAERAAAVTMISLREAIHTPMTNRLPTMRSIAEEADIEEGEVAPALADALEQDTESGSDSPSVSDEMTVVELGGYGYIGYLSVPKLGLKLPVMAQWDYRRLKTAPCRFSGSTKTDDLVIAAHNYSSHFGSLKKLTVGDTLTFTDMDGAVISYTVSEVTTLQPTQVNEMTASGYPLTLFTCTVGGKARVTIRCTFTGD